MKHKKRNTRKYSQRQTRGSALLYHKTKRSQSQNKRNCTCGTKRFLFRFHPRQKQRKPFPTTHHRIHPAPAPIGPESQQKRRRVRRKGHRTFIKMMCPCFQLSRGAVSRLTMVGVPCVTPFPQSHPIAARRGWRNKPPPRNEIIHSI